MTKRNALVRTLVWSSVLLLLIALFAVGLNGYSFADRQSVSYADDKNEGVDDMYASGDTSVGAAGIREIDISWVSGGVVLEIYDGADIQISETSSIALNTDEQMHYRADGSKLEIRFQRPTFGNISLFSRVNRANKQLTVRIPASISLEKLKIDNVSSEVHVTGGSLWLNKLRVESVSGKVDLTGLSAEKLEVETVSGNVYASGDFSQVDGEAVSGSLYVQTGSGLRKLELETVSGDVRLTLPASLGFQAKLDTVSGHIQCDYADSVDRKTAYHGDGSAKLSLDTVSGSVYIEAGDYVAPVTPSRAPAASTAPVATEAVEPSPETSDGNFSSSGRSF